MTLELRKIDVTTDKDWLLVHETAVQLARMAGLNFNQQIQYAASIMKHYNSDAATNLISFSMETDKDQHFLLASIKTPSITIRESVPQVIHHDLLPSLPYHALLENERLDQRLRDMDQFCYALSHELKTSLTKLNMSILLLEREELNETVTRFVNVIHRAASSLENTLTGLNQIIELGHGSPDVIRSVNMQDVFDGVYDEYAEMLAQSGATVTTDLHTLPAFTYIEVYLRTILNNVISNAIKYADPARPLQLSLAAHRQEDCVVLVVIDNGQGFDQKATGDRLFEPFTRFSDKTEGSGIGLFLVKSMVERNGGTIEVESEKGKGTTFRFYLKEYDDVQLKTSKN